MQRAIFWNVTYLINTPRSIQGVPNYLAGLCSIAMRQRRNLVSTKTTLFRPQRVIQQYYYQPLKLYHKGVFRGTLTQKTVFFIIPKWEDITHLTRSSEYGDKITRKNYYYLDNIVRLAQQHVVLIPTSNSLPPAFQSHWALAQNILPYTQS